MQTILEAHCLMNRPRKVIIFMPAYNSAAILEKTFGDLPKDGISEIILVDDGSKDNTVEVARKLGITVQFQFWQLSLALESTSG